MVQSARRADVRLHDPSSRRGETSASLVLLDKHRALSRSRRRQMALLYFDLSALVACFAFFAGRAFGSRGGAGRSGVAQN